MEFLQSLSESRMLSSRLSYRNYSAKQIAELVYLHLMMMRILASEPTTAGFAMNYAHLSTRYQGFSKWYQNATDIHLLIFALLADDVDLKMPETSQEFRETLYMDTAAIFRWLRDISMGHLNEPKTRSLFINLDGQFQIKDSSLKAIRRLVQDWPHDSLQHKQLSMTRLLQIVRVRARLSDLHDPLEKLAKTLKLEIEGVANPETGDKAVEDGKDPAHVVADSKKHSLLATLDKKATTMLGFDSIKGIAEDADAGVTSSADIAPLVKPLGGVRRRNPRRHKKK